VHLLAKRILKLKYICCASIYFMNLKCISLSVMWQVYRTTIETEERTIQIYVTQSVVYGSVVVPGDPGQGVRAIRFVFLLYSKRLVSSAAPL
jgi:hypothetical protein